MRDLKAGQHFFVAEKKTRKTRSVMLNEASHLAVGQYLAVRRPTSDDVPLFLSRTGANKAITVRHLNELVKTWCATVNLRGRYGSHTLRKTFGYHHRVHHKTDIPTLMTVFNHATQRQTLAYLGVQADDLRQAFMKEI